MRLAGTLFNLGRKGLGKVIKEGFRPEYLIGDVMGGAMSAALTPGDISDKAIYGVSDFLGSALTGGAVRQLPGLRGGPNMLTMAADMGAGMVGGGVLGYGAGDHIVRMKNGGQTPLEQLQAEELEAIRTDMAKDLAAPYLRVI
jgi:hypothetical protein